MHIRRWVYIFLVIVVGECSTRALHDPYDIDFVFDWGFWDHRLRMNYLVWRLPENSRIPLTMGGFRGKWSKEEKAKDTLRIVTTGAGHMFADNLDYGMAWPEQLQRKFLSKNTNVDIWNMAVNGSTVIFLERCLLADIIQAQPDVVILSHSGYNEALYTDIPEQSVVFPTMNWRNALLSSGMLRFTLQKGARQWNHWRDIPRQPKVSVADFGSSYERVITALKQQGISIVLLQQEVITEDLPPIWYRKELDGYRVAFQNIAQQHHLLYIDPRIFIQEEQSRYFDEQEYYSALMHQHIATTIHTLLQ